LKKLEVSWPEIPAGSNSGYEKVVKQNFHPSPHNNNIEARAFISLALYAPFCLKYSCLEFTD
jgi:hypothetical protein